MSKIITDSTGIEQEVFTAEELQEQKDDAIEEFKKVNPDQTEDLNFLQEELKKANEDLTKLKSKDFNFTNLRQQKETAEKRIEKIKDEVDAKIGIAKKEILDGVMRDHYNDTIKSLAGDDEELKKKIEFQYKRLQDSVSTKEEVTKKLMDAWTLATTPENTGVLNASIISSGGVSRPKTKEGNKFTPEEKELARKIATAGGMLLEEKDFN